MAVGNKLKNFDVYRKIPKDLTSPTMSGAIISIVSTIVMVILFLSEFSAYLDVTETSEMYVDYARSEQLLEVNLDIDFTRLPCDILSLDAQDVMGSHSVNLEGDLKKYRIDQNGNMLEQADIVTKQGGGHDHAGHAHDQSGGLDLDRVKSAFDASEGCKLKGYIYVNKVPGNFHVSTHAYGHIMGKVFQMNNIKTLDLSHKIHSISFGKHQDIQQIKKSFKKGVLSPLDNTEKIKEGRQTNSGIMHQYYLNIVPSQFVDLRGRTRSVYQFTSNNNSFQTQHLPAVYFRYDLSPVTVKFTLHRESFFHFLVQVCAIVGGVFTVAGIIDGMVHQSVKAFAKKLQIGKLG